VLNGLKMEPSKLFAKVSPTCSTVSSSINPVVSPQLQVSHHLHLSPLQVFPRHHVSAHLQVFQIQMSPQPQVPQIQVFPHLHVFQIQVFTQLKVSQLQESQPQLSAQLKVPLRLSIHLPQVLLTHMRQHPACRLPHVHL